MSINLLETVQQNLGYPVVQKIDPNTQQAIIDESAPAANKFSQAAIPAVLIGLYKYAETDEGAAEILQNPGTTDWIGKIFKENKSKAVEAVALYANDANNFTFEKMNAIAIEALQQVNKQLPQAAGIGDVKTFFSHQRNIILSHLTADLQIGSLLHDNALDDNTYKMQGGISGLIQGIGDLFSSPANDEASKN